ncbi:hypothetical protein L3X38_014824 [Prunus dulcis]|uniref:Uncharacterized protein n=1 Tax=Prunus dulcis TaxID=3755 RepID=A0AAD4ZIC1_PRUDU|nr:hypothetical protein L3X38_014824 [Prunus dulcis]
MIIRLVGALRLGVVGHSSCTDGEMWPLLTGLTADKNSRSGGQFCKQFLYTAEGSYANTKLSAALRAPDVETFSNDYKRGELSTVEEV